MSSKNKKGQNEPAKGKKGKKGKKKQEIKLSKVEETFYQLTVADCEKKISNLRKHLLFLDENNVDIKERIRSLLEDKTDAAAVITNKVNVANETIYEYNEKFNEISREYYEVKSKGDTTIADLEAKYKAMHDQLSSEIKTHKAHLNMLDEFPQIEQKLNYINELEEERRKEKEQETKDLLNSTERRIKGEREAMRKMIEAKMLHVSEEFTRTSTFRNAAYTQRLIRENIALEKEISVLVSTWQSTDQLLKEQVARYIEVKATFPALKEKKRELIMVAQQKTSLIEQLTSKYEIIKAAYVESLLYKTQYEDLVKYQLCGHFRRKELMKQAKHIGRNAHTLKTECMHMAANFERNKQEIQNLKSIISLIRETILKTIGVLDVGTRRSKKAKKAENSKKTSMVAENEGDELVVEEGSFTNYDDDDAAVDEEDVEEAEEEEVEIRAQSLLETLYHILSFYKRHKMSTASLETISYDHLLGQHSELKELSSDSLREDYKKSVKSKDVCRRPSEQFGPAPHVGKTIPTERPERCPLFDIEKGSTLNISSSDSNPEIMSVGEEPNDQEDALQSSSDYSAISNEPPAMEEVTKSPAVVGKESKLKLSLSEMPVGTILDVEMADEMDELEEEEMQRNERDDDIYFADEDRENLRDYVNDTEGEEEEMPIYMFY